MIKNCPATVEQIDRAEDVSGPGTSHLKGKTTRSSPKPAKSDEIFAPQEIFKKHGNVSFHVDAMHINGHRSLHQLWCPHVHDMCSVAGLVRKGDANFCSTLRDKAKLHIPISPTAITTVYSNNAM